MKTEKNENHNQPQNKWQFEYFENTSEKKIGNKNTNNMEHEKKITHSPPVVTYVHNAFVRWFELTNQPAWVEY